MKKVAIFGATSAIAKEVARCFAKDGASMFLVARDSAKLDSLKQDLLTRGAKEVCCAAADLTDTLRHSDLLKRMLNTVAGLDVALIAHGVLGDGKRAEHDYSEAFNVINTNFLSVVSLLTLLTPIFKERRGGSIAVISSVAGDRGRKGNVAYCSSKGALNVYLQGLRNSLHEYGVHVLTIKPGFVDTPMTAGFKKGPLFASPQAVGEGIYAAILNGKDEVYLPRFWWFIMAVIKAIPEGIFKRLSI